jgi:4-hydroxybenzoate polyprenyltransferase
MSIENHFKLFRVSQWYKNLLIFIPIIFSLNLFHTNLLIKTFLGFIALCMISSSYYIINDLKDVKKDKFHPEKRDRPIASGAVKPREAGIFSMILFILSISIAINLSLYFTLSLLVLFSLSIFYAFFAREVVFLDTLLISINFVIRATIGIFIINVPVSYWVILTVFFIALYLVSLKRVAEYFLGNSEKYRSSLKNGSWRIFEALAVISVGCAYTFFGIYSILNGKEFLLISLPIAIYLTISFFNELYVNPKNVRNPERFLFSKKNSGIVVFWILLIIIIFYLTK